MYCRSCGAEIKNGKKYCDACGSIVCDGYDKRACNRYFTIEITPRHIDIASKCIAAFAALLAVVQIGYLSVQWIKSVWSPSPENIVTTQEIRKEDVWYPDGGVTFTSYPAEISPGQWAQLDAIGTPDTEYYICVQLGSMVLTADRLLAETSSEDGAMSWTWKVPDDARPGIYSIRVFSNNGTENQIDYAVLDRGGKVFGSRPSREPQTLYLLSDMPETVWDNTDVQVDDPVIEQPTEPEEETSEIVYITDTGEKYHRDDCQYLSESKIPISKSDAINRGIEPCSKCNP